jgi:RNA recognition motif-containing protein
MMNNSQFYDQMLRSSGPAASQHAQSQSSWVFVSNLPRDVNESWVRMLFASIGTIDSVTLTTNESSGSAYVLFRSPDQAKAALHLNGFSALGINLQVRHPTAFEATTLVNVSDPILFARGNNMPTSMSAIAMPRTRASNVMNEQATAHKNLYILNLPLDASTDELTALFASYGNVVHCVILAMLDTQARRRGFIDMSTPKEAKEAIEGLNGFVWHGYPIEVSYAIVQRSGGPFDQVAGRSIIKRNVPRNRFNTGPRRIPSDSALDASVFNGLTQQFGRQMQIGSAATEPGHADVGAYDTLPNTEIGGPFVDPLTVFIAGLDPVAIIDDDDFRHALEPYGTITAATLCRDDNGTSRGFGIVTFASAQAASNACEAINGKTINGRRLTAHKYAYQSPFAALGSSAGLMQDNKTLLSQAGRRGTPTASSYASNQLYAPATQSQLNGNQFSVQLSSTAALRPTMPSISSSLQWPSNSAASYFTKANTYSDLSSGGATWASTLPPTSGLDVFSSVKQVKEEPPLFSRPSTTSRAIEIKPDPKDSTAQGRSNQPSVSAKLGDAFVPTSNDRKSQPVADKAKGHFQTASTPHPISPTSGDVTQTPANLSNNAGQALTWNGQAYPNSNSLGLDGLSPQSMLSTPSTVATSNIQTPATHDVRNSANVWSNTKSDNNDNFGPQNAISRRTWDETKPNSDALKHIGQTGSALLSLQSDVMDKQSRDNMPLLAPVGHEKSSPMRITSGKPRNQSTMKSVGAS